MNEQLQQKLLEWAKGLENFTVDQLPDVANQILAWQFWSSLLTSIILLVIIIASVFVGFKLLNKWFVVKEETFYHEGWIAGALLVFAFALIMTVPLYYGMGSAIKVILAPKLVILDTIKHLL